MNHRATRLSSCLLVPFVPSYEKIRFIDFQLFIFPYALLYMHINSSSGTFEETLLISSNRYVEHCIPIIPRQ